MTDRQWIREAFERFESPLLVYARRLVGDAERAQDVVQDTFFKLCRQRREAIEPRLAEWLYTVCRNAALDVRRRDKVMQVTSAEAPHGEAGRDADPGARTERKEETQRALAYLAELPEKQQEVLRLKFRGGLSYKEISRITGESTGNVGWLLHVGLKSLRAKLLAEVKS